MAAGDLPRARALFARAVRAGDAAPDTLDALADLFDPHERADLLGSALQERWGDWPPAAHARVAACRFDALRAATSDRTELADAALETLEAAARGGDREPASWEPFADPDRRAALLDTLIDPAVVEQALEQLAYAPAIAGVRAHLIGLIEAIGHQHAADAPVARAAERALHRFGARDAAHRVELARKSAVRHAEPPRPEPRLLAAPIDLTILVAGGHDRLRAAVHEALLGRGAREVREVPPAWEGQRAHGSPRVQGADLVLLLVRQIDHSTGDRVAQAARDAGAAVRHVRSASVAAVLATAESFARAASAGK